MFSIDSSHARPASRNRTAAVVLAVMAVGYSLLTLFYFYEDFFKFLGRGGAMAADRSGWLVSVDGMYLWTVLSPWRMAGAALAVALLGLSAAALWTGRPRARALTLITLWGVILPQVLWYTELMVDWHRGQGIGEVVMLGILFVTLPTVLLRQPGRPLADWSAAHPDRLLGLSIVCAWIGFAATEYIDHAYQLSSWTAYLGALAAIPLATLAVHGIYRMRAWSLLAGVGAAVALAMVPLASSWTGYMSTGGYIDSFRAAAAGSDLRVAMSMLIPLTLVWVLAAPFMHAFMRKLRAS